MHELTTNAVSHGEPPITLALATVAHDGRRWTRTGGWRVDGSAPADRVRFEVAQIPPSA